ncbi:uncharacterized protein LOC101741132 [Bombyx mori]|uniref:Sugar transporter n=1 Tax=Bombyx mori TaxID=7091 RepID=A0A8R2R4D7_BOMMO|nr:uncharacterized protein LOC101741132 [Bombyx mori]
MLVLSQFHKSAFGQFRVVLSVLLHSLIFGIWQRLIWWLDKRNEQILKPIWITDAYEQNTNFAAILGYCLGTMLMKSGRKLGFAILAVSQGIIMIIILYTSTKEVSVYIKHYFAFNEAAMVVLTACLLGEYIHPNCRAGCIFLQISALRFGNALSVILHKFFYFDTIASLCLFVQCISCLCIGFTQDLKPIGDMCDSEDYKLVNYENGSNKSLRSYSRTSTIYNYLIKPIIIITFSFILSEGSGRSTSSYMNFFEAKMSDISYVYYSDLIFSIVFLISSVYLTFGGSFRSLLFTMGPTAISVLGIVSVLSFLQANTIISLDQYLIPCLLFIYFVAAFFVCTYLPTILMAEIIPMKYKGTCLFLSNIIGFLITKISIYVFPHLIVNVKLYVVLIVSLIIVTFCLLVLYFILPETRGKTLKNIEERIVNIGINICFQNIDYTMDNEKYICYPKLTDGNKFDCFE